MEFMNQFDMAYNSGGFWWMLLYYPVHFGNFLFSIKIIDHGIGKRWSEDIIFLLTIGSLFIPCMIIYPCLWILKTKIEVN